MPEIETDQAAREATGAHPYGRYLEEFEVGAVYKHWPGKTRPEPHRPEPGPVGQLTPSNP